MHQGISRFRKGVVSAIAGLTATAGLIPLAASGAGAAASFDLQRFAGADRYDTAAKIATGTFTTADTVVIATGENYPDALAGNYIAGQTNSPILLTRRDSVPAQTQAAISTLKATKAIVLGGTDAIGAGGVPTGVTATRVAGATRYETAVAAGNAGTTIGTVDGLKTAIIASGENFPDALSAGPGAWANDLPLLLTPRMSLHAATRDFLSAKGIQHVIIMGGSAAIDPAVDTAIKAINTTNPIATTRIAGADRTETTRLFAEYALSKLGFTNTHMNVARGDLFPDALAGGPHAGNEKAPILLTVSPTTASNSNDTGVIKYATDHKATLTGGHIYGGVNAVSAAVESAIETAGGGTGTGAQATATERPELVSASVVGTVTSGINAGTTIQYVFDEAVNVASAVPSAFHAYGSGGTQHSGASAAAVSGNSNAVNVLFTGITSTSTAGDLTLATVDHGAIKDVTGATGTGDNAIGDAPLNQQSGTALPAGVTAAPDLTAVQNFRAANTTQTFVDFVFDETVISNPIPNGFHLVGLNNDEVVCNYNSGVLSSTITVYCTNADLTDNASTTALSATTIARGYVLAGTVGDAAPGNLNPLEAADVGNSGNTGAPDLVSATFNTAATSGATEVDQATLIFDQPVTTGLGPAGFQAYNAAGTEIPATAVQTSTTTPTQVLVTFANGSLTGAVGVSVDEGAVVAASGTNIGAPNQEDEVGVAGTTGTTTASRTAGPDLTGVTRAAAKDIFGNLSGGSTLTYTFDEDVAAPVNGDFYAYLADGTLLVATSCTLGSTDATDNTVTCTAFNVVASGTAASDTVENSIVAGAVDDTAVTAEDAGVSNPEGYEVAAVA